MLPHPRRRAARSPPDENRARRCYFSTRSERCSRRRGLLLLVKPLVCQHTLASQSDGDLEWDRLEAEPPRPARYQRSPPGETWSFARVRLGNAGQGQEARPPRKREEEGNRTAGWPGASGRQGPGLPVKTFPRGGLVSILRVHSFMMDTAERLRPGASWLTLWSTRIGDPYRRERGEGGVLPLLGSLPGAAPRSGSP